MAWTYSGDPSSSARDAIRFLVGDTDTNDQLVTNEAIASKFSRLADQTVGDLKVSLSQKADNARTQADELKALAAREGMVPVPYAGGISVSDKEVDRANSDRVDPFFTSGQFANTSDYGAGPARAPAGDPS